MRTLLILALCIASVAAMGKRCKNNDECEEDECCVNYVLTPLFGGHCQATRKEGESCTPLEKKNTDSKPDMYHFQCPCKAGLECVAKHEIEIFGHVVKHRPECVVPGDDGNDGNDGGDDDKEIGEPDAE